MPAARLFGSNVNGKSTEGEMKKPFLLNNFVRSDTSEESKTLNEQTLNYARRGSLKDKMVEYEKSAKTEFFRKPNDRTISSLKRLRALESAASANTPRSDSSLGGSLQDSDDEYLDSESDDEETPRTQSQSHHYWSNFEDSIKKIHDQTESLTLKARPNFKSSDAYKEVMVGMFGNTEYGRSRGYTLLKDKINRMANVTGLTSRLLAKAAKQTEPEVTTNDVNDTADDKKEMESELKGAKRGWKLLKRHVNETALEGKVKNTNVQWNMLRHHVSKLSNMEGARQDLYERYGVLPALQEDGTMQCKNIMWSQRAISLNQTSPSCYNIPSSSGKKTSKSKRSRRARPATSNGVFQNKTVRNQSSVSRPSSEKTSIKHRHFSAT